MKNLIYIFLLIVLFTTAWGKNMAEQTEKIIYHEVVVNAGVEEVYNSWTTKKGLQTFFGPECEIELRLFGPYHIHFYPENPVGAKGAEDEIIISYQKNKMISFTWGFPPSLMNLRENQKTIVMIRFEDLEDNRTKVVFKQSGWGEGEEWDKGYEYFEKAWKEVIFKRFTERFENGSVEWTKK